MKIYMVTAEHFLVPATITSIHTTKEGANARAAELVNLLLTDAEGIEGIATAKNWRQWLSSLQKTRDGEFVSADVWIRELDVTD